MTLQNVSDSFSQLIGRISSQAHFITLRSLCSPLWRSFAVSSPAGGAIHTKGRDGARRDRQHGGECPHMTFAKLSASHPLLIKQVRILEFTPSPLLHLILGNPPEKGRPMWMGLRDERKMSVVLFRPKAKAGMNSAKEHSLNRLAFSPLFVQVY